MGLTTNVRILLVGVLENAGRDKPAQKRGRLISSLFFHYDQ